MMARVKHYLLLLFYWMGGVWLLRLLGRALLSPGIRILFAHRVFDDVGNPAGQEKEPCADHLTRARFEARVRHLARWYRTIPLPVAASQLSAGQVSRRNQVVITFDDGYADNLTNACPILRKYGVPATFFVTTGCLDGGPPLWFADVRRALVSADASRFEPSWLGREIPLGDAAARYAALARVISSLKRMPASDRSRCITELCASLGITLDQPASADDRMLSWEEIRSMARDALFTIGAHTVTHQILSAAPLSEVASEVDHCTADLEQALGEPPRLFAYPNGRSQDYYPEHQRLLKEAGYIAGCAAVSGVNRPGVDMFALRREPVYGGEPFHIFALRVAGMNELVALAKRALLAVPRALARLSGLMVRRACRRHALARDRETL